ncbi:MAG: hypothetical protein DCC71_08170 [Proteobacteria bacterium]|nr:MAG: hypothetical protein DCC71_08170 [Pseudomonadota bacterium]
MGVRSGGFVGSVGSVGSERRKGPRTSFDGWVEVHVDGVRRLASGRDLSPGGIGLDLGAEPLDGATPVTCEFALPGISLPLELEGAIAWSDGSRAGIRFDGVDPGLAELLENHVAGRL